MVICGQSNDKLGIQSPNLTASQPLQLYRGSNSMHDNLATLQAHYQSQVDLNNHHKGGQSGGQSTCQSDQSQGYTNMVVPGFNTFNPAGPDGPNGGSQNSNLTLYTNRQNGWQDKWAFVGGEPTQNPPPAPDTKNFKGGRKNTNLSKNKKKKSKKSREKKTNKRKTNKRKTKMRKTKMRKTNKRKTKMRKTKMRR
jgi:hypothetical protein